MNMNKKGAALMQVLLITVILAGIATMLLRASLSRVTSSRKTRRSVSAQVLIQACMAEVNTLWSKKTPEAFRRDLQGDSSGPFMYCAGGTGNYCSGSNIKRTYECTIPNPDNTGSPYKVVASFVRNNTATGAGSNMYAMQYEITQGSADL
ncbi:hypothetical protein [Candidatus Avelusimicrobium facis]|uniref:hypothetical protein n=1 Tax=Candidatus Avelusimicrobium facis TaxID=3416203 RepID=UPI0015B589E1